MSKRLAVYPFLVRWFSKIEKRRRFIVASLLLSLVMLFSSFLSFNQLKYFLPVFALLTYGAVFFALLEGLAGPEWLMLFIHPLYFTLAFNLFYFLLPVRWLTRIPFVFLYGLAIYAILLSANIFNVGAAKSIQLFRVAFSVNFLLLTITAFLVFSLILSLKLTFFLNFLLIFFLTFPLVLHFLWSINPSTTFKRDLGRYVGLICLFLGEVGMVFAFMPLRSIIFALLLTGCFYSLLGLSQAYLEGRLFASRIREFIFVLICVLVVVLLTVRW